MAFALFLSHYAFQTKSLNLKINASKLQRYGLAVHLQKALD